MSEEFKVGERIRFCINWDEEEQSGWWEEGVVVMFHEELKPGVRSYYLVDLGVFKTAAVPVSDKTRIERLEDE